jgi:hypothetical protein
MKLALVWKTLDNITVVMIGFDQSKKRIFGSKKEVKSQSYNKIL